MTRFIDRGMTGRECAFDLRELLTAGDPETSQPLPGPEDGRHGAASIAEVSERPRVDHLVEIDRSMEQD